MRGQGVFRAAGDFWSVPLSWQPKVIMGGSRVSVRRLAFYDLSPHGSYYASISLDRSLQAPDHRYSRKIPQFDAGPSNMIRAKCRTILEHGPTLIRSKSPFPVRHIMGHPFAQFNLTSD